MGMPGTPHFARQESCEAGSPPSLLFCTHTRRSKVPKFLTKFPRTARILVGMSSLLALVVGSGAGIKWGA